MQENADKLILYITITLKHGKYNAVTLHSWKWNPCVIINIAQLPLIFNEIAINQVLKLPLRRQNILMAIAQK